MEFIVGLLRGHLPVRFILSSPKVWTIYGPRSFQDMSLRTFAISWMFIILSPKLILKMDSRNKLLPSGYLPEENNTSFQVNSIVKSSSVKGWYSLVSPLSMKQCWKSKSYATVVELSIGATCLWLKWVSQMQKTAFQNIPHPALIVFLLSLQVIPWI